MNKKKVGVITAVILAAVATTGMAFAAFSNNLTGAINVIGEAVSPSTCDNDGMFWELGPAVYDNIDSVWEVADVSYGGVSGDCVGLTLRYELVKADGTTIASSSTVLLSSAGSIAFSPRLPAADLEGFDVQYIIQ